MRKFLLVTLIGLVLALDMYAVANDIKEYYEKDEVEEIDKGYVTVYME